MGAQRSTVLWNMLEGVYSHLGFDSLGDEAFKQLVLPVIDQHPSRNNVRILHLLFSEAFGEEQVVHRSCFQHGAADGSLYGWYSGVLIQS